MTSHHYRSTDKNCYASKLKSAVTVVALTISSAVMANPGALEQSNSLEKTITQQAATTQQAVAKSHMNAVQLEAENNSLRAELKELQVYKAHLDSMIQSQNDEINSFDVQLEEIVETKKSIVPLMYSMLEWLEQHIAADKPIRIDARNARINKLTAMMPRADISDAEKYRRILEAYQIELEYGYKLGSYKALITIAGQSLQTEQLYLGRTALVARSADRKNYWSWSSSNKNWQPLDTSLGLHIDKAFDVANKQAAPHLLTLPVSLAVTEGAE
ncbi:DUF3450 domain-containing protein [Shewanella youngdeokensis]|uniref:DUF3450 domain-containing protein n=1 Tax=Shewanella youngdeokensis TaxID=2999068 RepID=A0ABZ0JW23_9GAMM|nr:DUF3450 domain-containing protein [Shewanella sp. DAU334]